MGESGSGVCSGARSVMNGPFSGLAGETGRLPGIGGSLARVVLMPRGLSLRTSAVDVSQSSNPSCFGLIGSGGILAAVEDCRRINLVIELTGRTICCIELRSDDVGLDEYGEYGERGDESPFGGDRRKYGDGFNEVRWTESARFADRAGEGVSTFTWNTGIS